MGSQSRSRTAKKRQSRAGEGGGGAGPRAPGVSGPSRRSSNQPAACQPLTAPGGLPAARASSSTPAPEPTPQAVPPASRPRAPSPPPPPQAELRVPVSVHPQQAPITQTRHSHCHLRPAGVWACRGQGPRSVQCTVRSAESRAWHTVDDESPSAPQREHPGPWCEMPRLSHTIRASEDQLLPASLAPTAARTHEHGLPGFRGLQSSDRRTRSPGHATRSLAN